MNKLAQQAFIAKLKLRIATEQRGARIAKKVDSLIRVGDSNSKEAKREGE